MTEAAPDASVGTDPDFERLLHFLKEQRGFDFTGYKRASLHRRVRRRMDELGIDEFESYQDHLLVHPNEFTTLFNTILINVTGFFRDGECWDHLRRSVVPDLLTRRAGQPVRAWSAGCASGEEAFSLAMVLAEAMGDEEFKGRVKIYATDVDEDALATARQGVFDERGVSAVPEELRERYFEPRGSSFVFSKALRRSVIFGRNDLVQDAPISHVDLLVCRNTLMYFNAETQSQILQRMHFALRPDGVLFLGRAEMLLSHPTLFRPLDMRRRLFAKVQGDVRDRPGGLGRTAPGQEVDGRDETSRLGRAALMAMHHASLVIDRGGRLAVATSRAALLFGLSGRDVGRPIQDLEVSYRPLELRTHLQTATAERRPVWVRDVSWLRGPGEDASFDVQVVPLFDETGELLGSSVTFNDVTRFRQLQDELQFANRQLETAYEELQSTNEELETTNEELQSTVEELETTNEELQSTNEELETMNEELQSMNDELQMSLEAQREQQEHYYRLSRYTSAVLGGMNAGVAVLDEGSRVVTWSSYAAEIWGVRPEEAEGQTFFDLDVGLPLEPLRPLVRTLLTTADQAPATVTLDAVNRRGKPVKVKVTLNRISAEREGATHVLVLMEVVAAADG